MLKSVGPTFDEIMRKVEILAPSPEIKAAITERLALEAPRRAAKRANK